MTACELLDLLIAELDQLRADNRRLNLELAAAADSVTAVQVPGRL